VLALLEGRRRELERDAGEERERDQRGAARAARPEARRGEHRRGEGEKSGADGDEGRALGYLEHGQPRERGRQPREQRDAPPPHAQRQRRKERDAHRQRLAHAVRAQERVRRAEVPDDVGRGGDEDERAEHLERRVQHAPALVGAHEEREQ
jgi:hypothetical protein